MCSIPQCTRHSLLLFIWPSCGPGIFCAFSHLIYSNLWSNPSYHSHFTVIETDEHDCLVSCHMAQWQCESTPRLPEFPHIILFLFLLCSKVCRHYSISSSGVVKYRSHPPLPLTPDLEPHIILNEICGSTAIAWFTLGFVQCFFRRCFINPKKQRRVKCYLESTGAVSLKAHNFLEKH